MASFRARLRRFDKSAGSGQPGYWVFSQFSHEKPVEMVELAKCLYGTAANLFQRSQSKLLVKRIALDSSEDTSISSPNLYNTRSNKGSERFGPDVMRRRLWQK